MNFEIKQNEKIEWAYYEIDGEQAHLYNNEHEKVDTVHLHSLINNHLRESSLFTKKRV